MSSSRPTPASPPPSSIPWIGVCLLVLIAAAKLWPGASDRLVYDRAEILNGDWWRLITAHITHFSTPHLLRNALLLLPAVAWLEVRNRKGVVLVLSLSPAISLTLLIAMPAIDVFAGSSGLTYGMIVALAVDRLAEVPDMRRWWWAVLVLAVLTCVMGLVGPTLSGDTDASASGIVHSLGALAGGIAGLVARLVPALRK